MVLLLDAEEAEQECIEDCQICCRPITVCVFASMAGELSVAVRSENELF